MQIAAIRRVFPEALRRARFRPGEADGMRDLQLSLDAADRPVQRGASGDRLSVPVDPSSVEKRYDVLEGVTIPARPHLGVIGVAPRETELIDSVPPACSGGNIDNWRAGKGAKIYLPVSVPGALLSIGDPHASQGEAEVCGTAIECSLTGVIQVVLHKKGEFDDKPFADLSAPIIETPTECGGSS